jgi:cold shock CspA family protein
MTMARQRFHENADRDRDGSVATGPRVGGILRSLMPGKGFGFITGDDGGDRFLHKSDMTVESKPFHELQEGDRCTFVSTSTAKGLRAVAVEFAAE